MRNVVLPSPGRSGPYPGYDPDNPTEITEECSWFILTWMSAISEGGIIARQDEESDYANLATQTTTFVGEMKTWIQAVIDAISINQEPPQFDFSFPALPALAGLSSGGIWGAILMLLLNVAMQRVRGTIGGQQEMDIDESMAQLVQKFVEALLQPGNWQTSVLVNAIKGQQATAVCGHLSNIWSNVKQIRQFLETHPDSGIGVLTQAFLNLDDESLIKVLAAMGLNINLNDDQTTIEYGPNP